MKKGASPRKIIWKPYNLDILKLCNSGNSISDISKKVGLTYKSTFLKIKELEKANLINIDKSEKFEGSKLSLNEQNRLLIEKELEIFNIATCDLQLISKNAKTKKSIIDLLKILKKRRFIDRDELFSFPINKEINYRNLESAISRSGLVRIRMEITKKGLRFLEKNKKEVNNLKDLNNLNKSTRQNKQ